MSQQGPEGPRFALVTRGYDREQVDASLAECERWASQAAARMQEVEDGLTEADQRAEALEARIVELEDRASDDAPRSVQWLGDVADRIMSVTRDAARELRVRMDGEANAERESAERTVGEIMSAAHAKAAAIAETARHDQEAAERHSLEARTEAARHIDQARAAAEQEASAIWNRAQGRADELSSELERVEDQRQAAVQRLDKVRGTLVDLTLLLAE